jgi:KDO2-lipid IV(A) lauroyltransferase
MSESRSRVVDYSVYLLVRVVVCALHALSYDGARKVAAVLAWLAYRIDRRHRLVAGDNLRQALGDALTEDQRDRMVRAVYRHFSNLLMEVIHVQRLLHFTNWRRYVDLAGGRLIVDGLLSGRPLMFVTGHFGNWELGGYVLGLLGFRTHAIARPLDNPYLDDFLRAFRERTGQGILAKHGDFAKMQAILKGCGAIATLGDQDAGQRGQFVDFFGRPASTHKAIALLSLEHNVPLLVIGVRKLGEPIRYEVVAQDLILPEEYEGRRDAIPAMTQRFTAALERIVRTAPEQYFWLHRRWKHQPPVKKGKKAA